MAQKEGRNFGRINASSGTALAAANVAIGAGWGTTGSFTVTAGSNDQAGQIVVTASGASFAQATATVVITFADGAYSAAPRAVIATTTNDNSIDTGHVTYSVTTTALTLTFSVLPVDTKIYKINYLVIA